MTTKKTKPTKKKLIQITNRGAAALSDLLKAQLALQVAIDKTDLSLKSNGNKTGEISVNFGNGCVSFRLPAYVTVDMLKHTLEELDAELSGYGLEVV